MALLPPVAVVIHPGRKIVAESCPKDRLRGGRRGRKGGGLDQVAGAKGVIGTGVLGTRTPSRRPTATPHQADAPCPDRRLPVVPHEETVVRDDRRRSYDHC